MKRIQKSKLLDPISLTLAQQECVIHSYLKNENIVELFEYTENKDDIILFMEYCTKANYFEDKIETVSLSLHLNSSDMRPPSICLIYITPFNMVQISNTRQRESLPFHSISIPNFKKLVLINLL